MQVAIEGGMFLPHKKGEGRYKTCKAGGKKIYVYGNPSVSGFTRRGANKVLEKEEVAIPLNMQTDGT